MPRFPEQLAVKAGDIICERCAFLYISFLTLLSVFLIVDSNSVMCCGIFPDFNSVICCGIFFSYKIDWQQYGAGGSGDSTVKYLISFQKKSLNLLS